MLTIDDFDDKYTSDTSLISSEFDEGSGMFETYGKDLKTVLDVANETPNRVWTAMDGDSGFFLVNGYHLVNRVYYIITNEEGGEDEWYMIDSYEEEEEEEE